jgi:TonB family protein
VRFLPGPNYSLRFDCSLYVSFIAKRARVCAIVVLLLLSISMFGQQSPNIGRAPVSLPGPPPGLVNTSAEYPNTTEGLRNLLNDMLAAMRQGDRERVDSLMKQTEFADYARYFVTTYNPDPQAANNFAIAYQRWLSENEKNLVELLETLAKDEDGEVLVRRASDDPAPGRGFEWGMLHYARTPIDVYRVTLVFHHSPDGPGESVGYFVYADGMFRWDSIVPFAAPGTYQSDPGTSNASQTQAAGSAQYPNAPDGLQEFLGELRAAARSGEHEKVDSMIKHTEIPEYRNWFCSVYIPGSGLSWAIPYGNNLTKNEQAFKVLWEKLAQDDGEIRVQKLDSHNARTVLNIFEADWKSRTGADEWIGRFIYLDGMFRWDSTLMRIRPLVLAQNSQGKPTDHSKGVTPPRVIKSPQPKYTEEARKAGLEGVCTLSLVVDAKGHPSDIKVLKGLGMGLDEEAIKTVSRWKFAPGLKDGKPVSASIAIMVQFHP